ncbi:MAG: ribonuclease H-like domain-containing protein [Eubacteriales bacterium]|nr:ribonuclease H-like domain-containing protein [Eubacteriales bacterium]
MKITNESQTIDSATKESLQCLYHSYPNEKLLFFDIETTGFVAKHSTLYLIGCLWISEEQIHIQQWFNESGKEECEILAAFIEFYKNFTCCIHFNGANFDIPYLRQKAEIYHLDFELDTQLYQIDILKEIRPLKQILHLDNLKQIMIEKFLKITREDLYSGGDLIKVYQHFVSAKNYDDEKRLLLHNHDDMLGMLQILPILRYKLLFDGMHTNDIKITDLRIDQTRDTLSIFFSVPSFVSIPQRLSFTKKNTYITALETSVTITIPIISGCFKHYFNDYKNYYYLPNEDTAIHKSVAMYVDSCNRIKATKNNCYTKMEGQFIPCYDKSFLEQFKENAQDKECYQLLDTIKNQKETATKEYVICVLKEFIKKG